MGLSYRIFLLDHDENLYRLPNTTFEQMLRDRTSYRFPRFAGARMRMSGVIVELLDRQPIRVVQTSFSILSFDREGYLDASAFERHQRARVELAVAPLATEPEHAGSVVDATERFVAQGGRWAPSRALARHIDAAALGRVKCERV